MPGPLRRFVLVAALSWTHAAGAELRDADLDQTRTVTERDWLALRLQVLGLELTYPAYRVHLDLTEGNRLRFVLWLGTSMAQHLHESGRTETERLLGYHARGIRSRVEDLLRAEFPRLWSGYEAADFKGEFMVPGEETDEPPARWARWEAGAVLWEGR